MAKKQGLFNMAIEEMEIIHENILPKAEAAVPQPQVIPGVLPVPDAAHCYSPCGLGIMGVPGPGGPDPGGPYGGKTHIHKWHPITVDTLVSFKCIGQLTDTGVCSPSCRHVYQG